MESKIKYHGLRVRLLYLAVGVAIGALAVNFLM